MTMNKLEIIKEDLNRFSGYNIDESVKDRLNKTLKSYILTLNHSVERAEIKAKENISYVAREVNK